MLKYVLWVAALLSALSNSHSRIIINETVTVSLGGIACKPCFDDSGQKFVDGSSLTVNQGSSVLTCIEMSLAGVCVQKIINLDLIVERSTYVARYCIISENPERGCLSLVGSPNPDYSPNPTSTPGYDKDDATVRYLVPGGEFSDLAPGETVRARYEGTVAIGLGFCCDDPVPAGCGYDNSFGRSGDTITTADFVGEEFIFVAAKAEEEKTDNTSITGFFAWLFHLFITATLSLVYYFVAQPT